MIASPTNSLRRKRARLSTNVSKEVQKEQYNIRRRAQRRASAAAKRNEQFDQFYMTRSMHPVDSGLHPSVVSAGLGFAVGSTYLGAQSFDPPTPCDLATDEATCSHQAGDDAITTTSAGVHPEGVLSRSPAASHIAVNRATRSHDYDAVNMETDLLESLLPSPTVDQNPAMEDDLCQDDLDASPCQAASPAAIASRPCSTAPTLGSSTATPDITEGLAKRLSDQLIQHHGCSSDCRRHGQEEHEEEHGEHWGLQQYLDHFNTGSFPDVLSVNHLAKREDRLGSNSCRKEETDLQWRSCRSPRQQSPTPYVLSYGRPAANLYLNHV